MNYCVKKGELTQDFHQVISLSTRMVVGLSCSDVSGEAGVGGGGWGTSQSQQRDRQQFTLYML